MEEFVNGILAKSYTLGHDVITQTMAGTTAFPAEQQGKVFTLVYDGHGSTRALLDAAAQVIQRYVYQAYGAQIDGQGLTTLANAFTSLLYSGEMTDKLTGLQNLRDRLYDARNGRFTQFDRYTGNNSDPASLHKYLYTNGNPINGIDPSGQMSVNEFLFVTGIALTLTSMVMNGVNFTRHVQAGKNWDAALDLAWLALDMATFFIPGGGGTAVRLAATSAGNVKSLATLIILNLPAASLWGYISSLLHIAQTVAGSGGGGSGSTGGEPGDSVPPKSDAPKIWYEGTPGQEINPSQVDVFRGGKDMIGHNFYDSIAKGADGLLKTTRGVSLDTNKDLMKIYGGAFKIKSIPQELKIVQRCKRLTHFELMPRTPMSEARYRELLDQVVREESK